MSQPSAERETARLRLRRPVAADLPRMIAITTDPLTSRHRPGGAPSGDEAAVIATQMIGDWDERGIGYRVVEHGQTVVGIAGIRPSRRGPLSCWNLYYRFAREAWGQGSAGWISTATGSWPSPRCRLRRPAIWTTRPARVTIVIWGRSS